MRTLLCILIIAFCGWRETAGWQDKNGRSCACNRLHSPVCGHDNVDYPNPHCASKCGQVSGYRRGTCDSPALCGCPFTLQPVCAKRPNGVLDNFDNRCVAECETGAQVVKEGTCQDSAKLVKKDEEPCICTLEYAPVCGLKNGRWITYGNECASRCAKVERTKRGACERRQSCACGRIYRPVCAKKPDGTLKSYGNLCEAQCENAEKQRDGNCEASPDNSLPRGPYKAKRSDCPCTREYVPVCALKNGKWSTHDNLCLSKCDGEPDAISQGDCPEASQLPASREDDSSDEDFWPRPDNSLPRGPYNAKRDICVCTREYWPVCALKKGKWSTYSNLCLAKCNGDPDATREGACPLQANQLPVLPDSGPKASQLPASPDDDPSDEDLVAAQLPYFPQIFKNFFQ